MNLDIKDRPGCITKARMRDLFEGAIRSTPAFAGNTPLGIIEVNGEFARFADADTDTMWLGFAIGMRCAERVEKAKSAAPTSHRQDYPTSAAVLGAEQDKAREDVRLFGVGFCVNGWHVPAQTVACWGMERASAAGRDVLAERQRQISIEGWTFEHDDQHDEGEMCCAAAGYAAAVSDQLQAVKHEFHGPGRPSLQDDVTDESPDPWPHGWQFKAAPPRRLLVKAGALILAEIERLDREAAKECGDA